MFNNIIVNHKSFGEGITSNFELDALNELNSKITVDFKSGITKKFVIKTFKDFFTCNDDSIDSYIDVLKTEEAEKQAAKKAAAAPLVKQIPVYAYDETNRAVSDSDWVKAYNVAGDHRWPHQSRAVVMNEDLMFINASAGLSQLDVADTDANCVYDICDHKVKQKKYAECAWRYATKEEIYENCLKGKNV